MQEAENPEEKDDRDRDPKQPEQDAAHSRSPGDGYSLPNQRRMDAVVA
jgi:hypothetical protein